MILKIFVKLHQKNNNIFFVKKTRWFVNDDSLKYEIIANRFLHHMVRFLVGTMIEVSRGKISLNDFKNLLKNENNTIRIVSAPAKGLFLKKIHY